MDSFPAVNSAAWPILIAIFKSSSEEATQFPIHKSVLRDFYYSSLRIFTAGHVNAHDALVFSTTGLCIRA